ncbi:hypothetical protein AO269_11180 [Pseudomonas putida]|nr:hypothetical protein AO269_11180 [Pseudomonas putida]
MTHQHTVRQAQFPDALIHVRDHCFDAIPLDLRRIAESRRVDRYALMFAVEIGKGRKPGTVGPAQVMHQHEGGRPVALSAVWKHGYDS